MRSRARPAQVFASSPANQAKGKDEIKEAQAYMRSMRLMQQGGIIPFDGFKQRKAYFLDEVRWTVLCGTLGRSLGRSM